MPWVAMPSMFVMNSELQQDVVEWRRLCRSNRAPTSATHVTVRAGTYLSGKRHYFHHHSAQEDVIHGVSGTLDSGSYMKANPRPRCSVLLPGAAVHASFNAGADAANIIAILRPCLGEMGVEQVDISGEALCGGLKAKVTEEQGS